MVKNNKKGQVTVFIIVGILIVVIAGVVLFVNREQISTRQVTPTQVEPVREYLRGCVEDEIDQELKNFKLYGGRSSLDQSGRIFSSYNVIIGPNNKNNLNSIPIIRRQIEDNLKTFLMNDGCSLQNVFSNDFVIEERKDNIDVSVAIMDERVFVVVLYPIKLTRGDYTTEINDFTLDLDDNFGRLFYAARDVINKLIDGQMNNMATYCGDIYQVYCVPTPQANGWKLVTIGDKDDYEKSLQTREEGELFRFVIAP